MGYARAATFNGKSGNSADGLTLATMVTLIIVPVFYSIFVFDLKIVRWEDRAKQIPTGSRLFSSV